MEGKVRRRMRGDNRQWKRGGDGRGDRENGRGEEKNYETIGRERRVSEEGEWREKINKRKAKGGKRESSRKNWVIGEKVAHTRKEKVDDGSGEGGRGERVKEGEMGKNTEREGRIIMEEEERRYVGG